MSVNCPVVTNMTYFAFGAFLITLLINLKPLKPCNGTRLKVKVLHGNIVEAIIFTGCAQRKTVFVPQTPLILNDLSFYLNDYSFPFNVCLATTINRSQRQALKIVGIYLRENCFSHKQFYMTR